jgi:D-alanine transaminase
MAREIWFNGEFRGEGEKLVSVQDRALCFGDGLFEVLRCIEGRFLLFGKHIGRMRDAAAEMSIGFPWRPEELLAAARELCDRNGIRDGELYVELTRGESPRYHPFPQGVAPKLFMVLNPLRPMPEGCRERGVGVLLYPDLRHGLCRWKTLNLLVNVLAKEECKRRGEYEACFFREDGQGCYVTEGASSSFFAVAGGRLVTPELDNILPGATRAAVIALARAEGLEVAERRLRLEELQGADEAFLVSTVSQVMPLIAIEGRKVGSGSPGPLTLRLKAAYERYMAEQLE